MALLPGYPGGIELVISLGSRVSVRHVSHDEVAGEKCLCASPLGSHSQAGDQRVLGNNTTAKVF